MAGPPGFNQAQEVNSQVFQNAFTAVATMTGTPLIGNPEATAVRLEELTSVVGTLAEALFHAVPLLNNTAANTNSLSGHAVNLEAQINTVETKMDYAEFQRAQGKGGKGNAWIPKAACESKAIQNIKNLGSDKANFRLWNQKFVNAVTQIHPMARRFFEALQIKLDTAKGTLPDP